jgi:hypothetical protein
MGPMQTFLPEEHKVDEMGRIRGVVDFISEIHRSWRLLGEGSRRDISGEACYAG